MIKIFFFMLILYIIGFILHYCIREVVVHCGSRALAVIADEIRSSFALIGRYSSGKWHFQSGTELELSYECLTVVR